MHMHSLNWLAILVAAISTMMVGFLWYSPVLFREAVDARDGLRPERQSQGTGNAEECRTRLRWLLCCQPSFRLHVWH